MANPNGNPNWKKGKPKTGGREKGTPNKLTTDMKQFYFDILNHVKMNGLEGAVAVFSKNDRNKIIFYQGGFRMLPSNVDIGDELKKLLVEVVFTDKRPKE